MALFHLGLEKSRLIDLGAVYTAAEIEGQPQLWLKTWDLLEKKKADLEHFLHKVFNIDDLNIILTGAGTSAFIGDVLQGTYNTNTTVPTLAVSTTDLVTHPGLYLREERPLLLISFARSGNSPESVAAYRLAEKFCKKANHLIITCNPEGKLAREASRDNCFVFLTPPEADDQGLAMTGSFTSMLLSGLLISQIGQLKQLRSQVQRLSEYGTKIMLAYLEQLKHIAHLDFQRAIFLGSGPFKGIACESHLKVQELSDGKIVCKYDSFLGFRHGPKAIMNDKSLIVYLFSNNMHARKYELDLVNAVNESEKGLCRLGIMESDIEGLEIDTKLVLADKKQKLKEEFLAICSVLPAQIIGMFKSLQLGLRPDTPSESGTITRVVEGVHIYPYQD